MKSLASRVTCYQHLRVEVWQSRFFVGPPWSWTERMRCDGCREVRWRYTRTRRYRIRARFRRFAKLIATAGYSFKEFAAGMVRASREFNRLRRALVKWAPKARVITFRRHKL